MATVDVFNLDKQKVGEVDLPEAIFGCEVKRHLFWEVVRSQQAARRRGTHSAKTRSEVTASGSKLFRQKGTGRARHGSRRAPLFVGGGVAFPPRPRSHKVRVPRKVRQAALRSALSLRQSEGKLTVLESFELAQIKTKQLVEILGRLGVEDALIVDGDNANLKLSVRNLPRVTYLPVGGLNVLDLLRHSDLLLTREALSGIEGRLSS